MTDDLQRTPTARWTSFLGWDGDGDGGRPDDDDLAEAYHEASKNLPHVRPPAARLAAEINSDLQAQATVVRAIQRHPARPVVALPEPRYPPSALRAVLHSRRSRRRLGDEPLTLPALSTLLHAAYGVTDDVDTGPGRHPVRSVPSGGALYPLEIYPAVRNVDGLAAGLYHYDPARHVLEVVRPDDDTDDIDDIDGTTSRLGQLLIPLPEVPDLAGTCAVVLFVVGVFWRTRFKYALRGYRWVLIEAGHVGQNVLLAAEALGLHALPYGGIWDRRVDDYLGVDGVNESVVYTLVAGSPGPEGPDDEGLSRFS